MEIIIRLKWSYLNIGWEIERRDCIIDSFYKRIENPDSYGSRKLSFSDNALTDYNDEVDNMLQKLRYRYDSKLRAYRDNRSVWAYKVDKINEENLEFLRDKCKQAGVSEDIVKPEIVNYVLF